MYARAREYMRRSECDVTLPGSGGPTRRSIGKTAHGPDSGAVAPTADQEISLDKAGELIKIKCMMDPIPAEGPPREAVSSRV